MAEKKVLSIKVLLDVEASQYRVEMVANGDMPTTDVIELLGVLSDSLVKKRSKTMGDYIGKEAADV